MSMNDTLNFGNTMPKDAATGSDPSADSLDLGQTVRMPGTGSLIFGRYRLQRVLGRGGMGVVWLAVDTKLERTVALKFLPDIIGADPAALRDLKDETRRGLDLAHPNIVRIYDFVDDDEAAAISMEFVDGKSLSENRLIKPHKVFSAEEIGPWIGQMCDALDYAHIQRKIVHRDLKPANLMVNAESQLKITDFGIARSVSDSMSRLSMHNANTSGTLLYMSPQQAMGDRPRPTDDIYSVGATIYELLTGKPPFYSGDISRQITAKTAPTLRQRREELEIAASDDIPLEWEKTIAACLDKDPERRPQTAGELARRLGVGTRAEITQGGSGVKATSLHALKVPATRKAAKVATSETLESQPMLSKRVLAVAAAILLVLFMLGGGLVWWLTRPGQWELATEPAGAKVSVAGKTLVTPAVFTDLKAGTYEANLSMEGYEPQTVSFTVASGQKASHNGVNLARSTGQIVVSSDPDRISFEIRPTDGSKIARVTGETPRTLRLPVGRYEVTMKHEGEIKTSDFVMSRNDEVYESFKFAPPPPPLPMVAAADTPPPPSSSSANMAPAPPTPPEASTPPPPAIPPAAAAAAAGAADAPPPMLATDTPGGGTIAGSDPAIAAATAATMAAAGAAPGQFGPPSSGMMMAAASVGEPASGSWKLDEILANSEYSGISENGRRYVLYRAQQVLKEKGHYSSTVDGSPGKGTHKAIQAFQSANGLQSSGQLDSATLAALSLAGLEDKSTWSTPQRSKTRSRSSGGDGDDDDPSWFSRKNDTIKKGIEKGIRNFMR